jgi:preprotein translocase subunit YajC
MVALIVVVILFALFWLVLVRPQRRKTQEQIYLIDSLEEGDEIVSAGGFYAVIKEIEGETLHVEIADGIVVRMARNAVVGLVEPDEERDEGDATASIEDDST